MSRSNEEGFEEHGTSLRWVLEAVGESHNLRLRDIVNVHVVGDAETPRQNEVVDVEMASKDDASGGDAADKGGPPSVGRGSDGDDCGLEEALLDEEFDRYFRFNLRLLERIHYFKECFVCAYRSLYLTRLGVVVSFLQYKKN